MQTAEKVNRREEILQMGNLLRLYVQQFQANIDHTQQASLLHRNPYLHSRKAKENLKMIQDSCSQCLDTIFLYVALLAKEHLCDKKELREFFFQYEVLFGFQEDVKKFELQHLLLIKDQELTAKLYKFILYTEYFICLQEDKIISDTVK